MPTPTEYGAYQFTLEEWRIKFRVAKITLTKIGQFVTLYKRVGKQPIQPYEALDPFDLLVISTRHGALFGQFVIPKSALVRVYPP